MLYQMSQKDLDEILDACKPVSMIALQCGMPMSQQERANLAWKTLGSKMGFDYKTVRPIPGKGDRFFTAKPKKEHTHVRIPQ